MVDELSGAFARTFAHRGEDARLRYAAEIVLNGRAETHLHHVEARRARQPIRLGHAAVEARLRDAAAAIGIEPLIERVDAIADAMGEQRQATGIVESGEPIPQRILVHRQIRRPILVPLGDRLGIGCLAKILALFAEEDVIDRRLQTRAGRAGALEGVAHQLVQQRRQRDLRIGADRIAKRERAVRSQLGDKPFGQRLDDIFLVILLWLGRLAADRDDGALDAAVVFGVGGISDAIDLMALGVDRRLVLRPDIATTNDKLAFAIDADEHAGAHDLSWIVDSRALLECFERSFDFVHALVDLVGQFVGFGIFRLEPVVLLAQRLASGALVVGEIDGGTGQGTKTMIMAVRQVGIDADPLPAFGRDLVGVRFQLVRD